MKLLSVSVRGDPRSPSSLDAPPREVRVGVVRPVSPLQGLEELRKIIPRPVAKRTLGLLDGPVSKSPHPHQLPEVCPLLLGQPCDTWVALLEEALGFSAPLVELLGGERHFGHDVEGVEGYARVIESEQERLRHVPVVDPTLE